jgi:hypothetical protein
VIKEPLMLAVVRDCHCDESDWGYSVFLNDRQIAWVPYARTDEDGIRENVVDAFGEMLRECFGWHEDKPYRRYQNG